MTDQNTQAVDDNRRRVIEASESMAALGTSALEQSQYGVAAQHFGRAAANVAMFDRAKADAWRQAQADALEQRRLVNVAACEGIAARATSALGEARYEAAAELFRQAAEHVVMFDAARADQWRQAQADALASLGRQT